MMDIEIIPNWHPILVHFTVALLSISGLLYLAGRALKNANLLLVARWNLWIGAIITIGTVLAGFYAYNTVAHDAPSHAAMTDHKTGRWSRQRYLAHWRSGQWRSIAALNPSAPVLSFSSCLLPACWV